MRLLTPATLPAISRAAMKPSRFLSGYELAARCTEGPTGHQGRKRWQFSEGPAAQGYRARTARLPPGFRGKPYLPSILRGADGPWVPSQVLRAHAVPGGAGALVL